jgi:hypothetical protein
MGTAADAFFTIGASESATLMWVGTVPGTGSSAQIINVASGLRIREWTSPQFAGRASSGATVTDASTTGSRGSRVALALRLDRSSDELEFFVNGTPTGSPADASGVGAIAATSILSLGRLGAGDYATATHECVAFIKVALTSDQVGEVGEALIERNGG